MKLSIAARLEYFFAEQADVLLQLEAAAMPDQTVERAHIAVGEHAHFARVAGHDTTGERIWISVQGRMVVDYTATIVIDRQVEELSLLHKVPLHQVPGDAIQYLMGSRYCPSDQFYTFVAGEFGALEGGARIRAMRDWIRNHFSYVPGASNSATTAVDTFVTRQGVCRDYSHVLIAFARVSGIPARMVSVYALGVEPQDFHAVAEVYLGGENGGEWRLVDATGMGDESTMARIGVGRDAVDVAFMTSYETASFISQAVTVSADA